MPVEAGDAARLARLLAARRDAGYSRADVRKIAHQNRLPALKTTWQPA